MNDNRIALDNKLGFGCMRLPMRDGEIDYDEFSKMIDYFIGAGFNYFDTAHNYINGKSEVAIKECLVKRYNRNDYKLANKLTGLYFNSPDEIELFFENQLKWCGVDYFDCYIMHAQERNSYKKFKKNKAYEIACDLRESGKIEHLGMSFHDKPEILDMILSEQTEIEFVQIQFNYLDYEDPSVESKKLYEICVRHKKPVFIMEPLKGGRLADLPKEADQILKNINNGTNASFALRFALGFENVTMVLSGMSSFAQMNDNIKTVLENKPLTCEEMGRICEVREIINSLNTIPCTACRYCVDGNKCPKNIRIPEIFSLYNTYKQYPNWNTQYYYTDIITGKGSGKPSDCVQCGKCEKICPQHLPIRTFLTQVDKLLKKQ